MEPHWHRTPTSPPNSQAEARWRPALQLPRLRVSDKSGGGMAFRYRPRQDCATHRWPPSGGFQCSFLSKDKLYNRLLFYEFTLRSVFQKRLRKILGLSRSTLRQNSVLWKVARSGLGAAKHRWDSRLLHNVRQLLQLARAALYRPPRLTSELYALMPSQTGTPMRTREEPILWSFWSHFTKQRSKWAETLKKAPFSSPEKRLFAVKFQKWTLTFEIG